MGYCLLAVSGCLLTAGCGDKGGLPSRVLHGSVLYGEEKAEMGRLRFVPIEGTPGSASTVMIVDGQYRVEARGGVPIGKHRVEVDARRKTGRKVPLPAREGTLIEETVRMGPDRYAGTQSPLTIKVTEQSDGRIDIIIPR